ncbi:MAG: MBL fold metallo-hydrolase [Muribaculaceae bacterium]|nr:MBL fold metallo-hydrolase [Muribaculaceae bacterium]
MELTFLGTGTSTGVPQMRCNCRTCTSEDPRDKRLRTSALLKTEPGAPAILIDCGPDFRQQMLANGCPDLAAVLLTHTHYDHVGGIDDLRPYVADAPDHRFPVYCREDVARDLRNRIPYCFTENPYPGVPAFNIHIIEAFKPFKIHLGENFADVEFLPLPVMHAKLPIFGFRTGNFAYITDCKTLPDETIDALKGLDTLVINALRINKHMSHINLKEALDVIKATAPRKAFLTHMSHDMGPHEEVSKMLPENTVFAFDGLTVTIT